MTIKGCPDYFLEFVLSFKRYAVIDNVAEKVICVNTCYLGTYNYVYMITKQIQFATLVDGTSLRCHLVVI